MTVFADHAPSLPATLDLTLQSNDWRVPVSCLDSAGYLPRVTVEGTSVAASLVPDHSTPPTRKIGGSGRWLLVISTLCPVQASVTLMLHRPWLNRDPSALVHTIEVAVHELA